MKKIFIPILSFFAATAFAQVYVNPLAIPPVMTGTNFLLDFNDTVHQFYPPNNTNTYGVNGTFLGPTLIVNKGDSVNITVQNDLPVATTCHWHGLHVPAYYDGNPHSSIVPGSSWTASFRIRNNAATYWYHPHQHMNTQAHVTMGIAGMIIVKDSVESQLALPRTYSVDDFPIVLQDRKYSAYQFVVTGLGDSMLVNGMVNPYLDCPRQVVRLRLLNGSNARVYNLGFSDNRNFYVIAGDGGLISAPYQTNRLLLANGERAEILIDLSSDTIGTNFLLQSFASEMATDIPGAITGMMGGNGPLEAVDFGIMQINVVAQTSNPVTTIPSSLVPVTPWNVSSANRIRTRSIGGMGNVNATMGNFNLDGSVFDMNTINDTMLLNDIEVWDISSTANIAHPIHLHDVQFYIVSRNGNAPAANESGLKDVVLVKPNETVRVITKFEDFANDTFAYMYHCHNLAHEDMDMMLQFIVIDPQTSINESVQIGEVSVYPNPASGEMVINCKSHEQIPSRIVISDLQGKQAMLIDQPVTDGNTVRIETSELAPGMYLLMIETEQGSKVVKICKY